MRGKQRSQEQSDLSVHCLLNYLCPSIWVIIIITEVILKSGLARSGQNIWKMKFFPGQ